MAHSIRHHALIGLTLTGCYLALPIDLAQAQVIIDSTLSTVTVVGSPDNRNFTIEGGSRSGNNLFQSFSQFSVPTNGSAIFNNATDVQNIFSRVTGVTGSTIDGLIQAQGSANLFLLNPNGIVFGPNAKLNIGGSFLGTTASSLEFADGTKFSATNPTALLTMSVPIGLQMGQNPGAIAVTGTGHSLASPSSALTPYLPIGPIAGLKVQPGKTLALVGGSINLTGGTLTAERGRIEVGSLGALETAGLENVATSLWTLNTSATQKFSDITLANRSLVDVSGAGAGSIQVQGQRVSLTDGSLILSQNRGIAPAGDIQIKADSLNIMGGIGNRNIRSAIINETLGGNSGTISVAARQINLTNGGSLFSRSFNIGSSGNVSINASESVKIDGFLAENPLLNSTIGTSSFSPLVTGRSGNVTLSTPSLSLQNGGIITATTFGNAAAGSIDITADQIEVMGRNPSFFESTIASSTFGNGSAGNIMIKARSLLVKDQGTINTSSFSNGDAGSIVINSSESIDIGKQSSIASSVRPNSPALIAALNLPRQPRGNAGSVVINVPVLNLRDEASIAVSNRGLGDSGQVRIAAGQVLLGQNSQITAATASGEGGNVVLQSQMLILRDNSGLAATAGGAGNGGNITIDSPIILGLENSDIVANAVRGQGGNIQITTQGILGLKFRPQLTPENDITASSEFGVNGTVEVKAIGVDPNSGLTALPINLIDPNQKIAAGCTDQKAGSFVVTGRGGMPNNPIDQVIADRPWTDLRAQPKSMALMTAESNRQTPGLIEATAWQLNAQNQPELVARTLITRAEAPPRSATDSTTCAQH